MLLAEYPAETVQIYFPASLELQEELIKNGFGVPRPTPIPIIYINFKGWVVKPPPISIERLIHASRYGKSFADMNWIRTSLRGKEAYQIPPDECYISYELLEGERLKIKIHPLKYHLERISIRGINPDKWTNWAMVYIASSDAKDLRERLVKAGVKSSVLRRTKKEVQQGGKEQTSYVRVEVDDFKLCLGCFEDCLQYLKFEAARQNLDVDIARIKLSLRRGEENSFLKVGVSQMEGKHTQLMIKLASVGKKAIRGTLKPILEGKPRGSLEFCNHIKKELFIVADASQFLGALESFNFT